jgi:hypothetical protein
MEKGCGKLPKGGGHQENIDLVKVEASRLDLGHQRGRLKTTL